MIKRLIRRIMRDISPNEFTSLALRDKFAKLYNIEIGLYSYGCFDRSRIDPNTKFGRYCSISPTARIFRRNHGVKFIALTPYLYNSSLGVVSSDTIIYKKLEVSDDVWLGHNCIILPSVNKIGRGSIVAAGAVVTCDVEPYSIVGGNPAKFIKSRFDRELIKRIEDSGWWNLTPEQLRIEIKLHPDFYFNHRLDIDE